MDNADRTERDHHPITQTDPVVPASPPPVGLAEGPFWDPARRRLLWVDIDTGTVFVGVLDDRDLRVTDSLHLGPTVGAVTVALDGSLLVAAARDLVVILPDGRRERGPVLVPEHQARRFNDGGTDPVGRFLVGTLALDGGSAHEELMRLEPDGGVTVIDDDLGLSNGLAWSPDGSLMYSVDSDRRVVNVRSYDTSTGACGPRRVHVTIPDGYPDGIAMDAEGSLWIAVWGAGEVRRFAPDGTETERFPVPAPHTSSVAFAGDDLRTLVITTSRSQLTPDQLQRWPDSGRLFTVRTDVSGSPVPYWDPTR